MERSCQELSNKYFFLDFLEFWLIYYNFLKFSEKIVFSEFFGDRPMQPSAANEANGNDR